MGKFGWTHIVNANKVAQGPAGAVQFASASSGIPSGSAKLVYNVDSNNLVLSGTLDVSGTIRAHVFDVKQTTKEEITVSGSTNFGDDAADTHVFTGSLSIVSGGLRQHYYPVNGTTYTVQQYDSILGIRQTNYTAIQLQSAATAGIGRIMIIKDETTGTRPDSKKIAISASGGQTIDGQATYSLSGDNPALTIYSNGDTKWFIY